MICKECKKKLTTNKEQDEHFHAVQTVAEKVYLIDLPDGCEPGRWEAAEAFAKGVAELRNRYPYHTFAYTPFSSDRHGQVTSWLAISN
jgi:hypothetical protein